MSRDVSEAPEISAIRTMTRNGEMPKELIGWIQEMRSLERSPRTIAGYLWDLLSFQRFLKGRPHGRGLLETTEEDLREFSHAMVLAGLAPSSRQHRLVAIRQFYAHAIDLDLLQVSPARRLKLVTRQSQKVPEFLKPHEVTALRRVIPTTPRGLRDRAMIELGLSSLRLSEVVGIQLHDVFLDRGQVRIIGKGGGEYLQPVTEVAMRAIKAWLGVRPSCLSRFVFIPLPIGRRTRGMHGTTLGKVLTNYVRTARIQRAISFHALRHTVGVTLADKGVPLQYIQDLLRHRDPKTTRVYTQVAKDRLSEVLKRELVFPE